MKRAIRRHHYYRLKNKVVNERDNIPDNMIGFYVSTPQNCSCIICGNLRHKLNIITRQEYLFSLKYIEQCDELNIHHSLSICNIK